MFIKFLMGPYDGHQQYVNGVMQDRVFLPVSQAMFDALDGKRADIHQTRPTSVAIYDFVEERNVYIFMGCLRQEPV